MKTLVLTVPHSGTHFLLRFLVGVLGLDGNEDATYIGPESTADFAHAHPNSFMKIQEGVFDSLIITLRNPLKSTQTGKLRGANIDQMVDSWQSLLDTSGQYAKVLFLVIDGPEESRFPQLMDIAKHFGKEHLEPAIRIYADDWTPVNQSITDEDKAAMDFAVEAYEKWQS